MRCDGCVGRGVRAGRARGGTRSGVGGCADGAEEGGGGAAFFDEVGGLGGDGAQGIDGDFAGGEGVKGEEQLIAFEQGCEVGAEAGGDQNLDEFKGWEAGFGGKLLGIKAGMHEHGEELLVANGEGLNLVCVSHICIGEYYMVWVVSSHSIVF